MLIGSHPRHQTHFCSPSQGAIPTSGLESGGGTRGWDKGKGGVEGGGEYKGVGVERSGEWKGVENGSGWGIKGGE